MIDKVLISSKPLNNKLPESKAGHSRTGTLVPVIIDGDVIGCIATTSSTLSNDVDKALAQINEHIKNFTEKLSMIESFAHEQLEEISSIAHDIENSANKN